VLDGAAREVNAVLVVEDGEAFDIGAAAGEEVADSWMNNGEAYGFKSLGVFGVAGVEVWGDEHEAGDLNEYLGGEGEEGAGKRGSGVADFWVALSGLEREVRGWGRWSVPWGRCGRGKLTLSRGFGDPCSEVIVESRGLASSWN